MHGLEQGSAALKALQAEVNLDRVERIMDESREGVEYQREIDEALASHMSPEEEEAVLRELEELQREQMVSGVWGVGYGAWNGYCIESFHRTQRESYTAVAAPREQMIPFLR